MANDLRLNIGAGSVHIPGFTPVDRKLGSEAYPLAYPDNCADEIRASHVLEHFGFGDIYNVVIDWTRVLKPGGRLRIAVPDVEKIIQAMASGDRLWPNYLMGGQTDADDFHRSVFTYPILATCMINAKLERIGYWESDGYDTSSHPVSLNLEGFKPTAVSRL